MSHRFLIFSIIIIVTMLLAACQPQDNSLPTLARFPTDTATPADIALMPRNTLPPTFTPTHTRTVTPGNTPTDSPTTTGEPSLTPSPTITDTPSPTPTNTPLPPTIAPEDRPLFGLLDYARQYTPLPPDFIIPEVTQPFNPSNGDDPNTSVTGSVNIPQSGGSGAPLAPANPLPPTATFIPTQQTCNFAPSDIFARVYNANPSLASQLGCATIVAPNNIPAAWQNFQTGAMVWLSGEVYVFNSGTGTFTEFPDTFDPAVDPDQSTETAPAGLFMPVRGFLKIWANNPAIRDSLGYGTNPEQGTTAKVLLFDFGRMVELPGRQGILVLIGGTAGSWQNITP